MKADSRPVSQAHCYAESRHVANPFVEGRGHNLASRRRRSESFTLYHVASRAEQSVPNRMAKPPITMRSGFRMSTSMAKTCPSRLPVE